MYIFWSYEKTVSRCYCTTIAFAFRSVTEGSRGGINITTISDDGPCHHSHCVNHIGLLCRWLVDRRLSHE